MSEKLIHKAIIFGVNAEGDIDESEIKLALQKIPGIEIKQIDLSEKINNKVHVWGL